MNTSERGEINPFNDIPAGEDYPQNEKWQSHLLDQYKLYVEMADRISNRRSNANSYFLSVNSAILAFVGYLSAKDTAEYLWLLALAGITLSCLWAALIRSYRNLNSAKFFVIQQIETRLPVSPYKAEWQRIGSGSDVKRYRAMTHIERGVPLVFMVLHLIVLVRSFPSFLPLHWLA